jgi:hypothetical protein
MVIKKYFGIEDYYHEIEVEYSFLYIFKWKVKYRQIKGIILRYKEPNQYFSISIGNHVDLCPLFFIKE